MKKMDTYFSFRLINYEPHSRFARLWLAWSHGGGITAAAAATENSTAINALPASHPADRLVPSDPSL